MQTSGLDLKVERVKANLSIRDLAARMQVSRQTIWAIERAAYVADSRAVQYREALVTSVDIEAREGEAS